MSTTQCVSNNSDGVPAESLVRLIKLLLFGASGGNFARYMHLRGALVRRAASLGLYERTNLQMLRRLLRPGDVVLDVGANVGVYTLAMSRLVGRCGSVIAFEPQRETFMELRRLTDRHSGIQVVRQALSHTSGYMDLSVPRLFGILPEPALATCEAVSGSGCEEAVSVSRLDDLPLNFDRLSFIKVDIEGHELSFLRGSHQTIAKHRPWIQMEWMDRKRSADELYAFCATHDYRVGCVDRWGRLVVEASVSNLPVRRPNIYLLPDGDRRGLGDRGG